MRDVDTALLRTFCSVCETGSFSIAALRVGRTQSAVSDQIKRLENFAGARLLDRSTRSVRLTRQGEDFLRLSKEVLQSIDTLASAFAPDQLSGEIGFGAPEDFATTYLPGILGAFAAAHPNVRLHVSCELTLELIERLRRGERDLVVIKTDIDNPLPRAEPLWREDLVWVGRSSHEKPFATVCAELERNGKGFPLVSAPPPCVYRSRATRQLGLASAHWSNVYVSPSFAGSLAAVRAGLGYMVMPEAMVPADLVKLGPSAGWPSLQQAEICLLGHENPTRQSKALATFIRENAHSTRSA